VANNKDSEDKSKDLAKENKTEEVQQGKYIQLGYI